MTMRWWGLGFLAYLMFVVVIVAMLQVVDEEPEPPKWVNRQPRAVRDVPRLGHPPPELVNGNNEW